MHNATEVHNPMEVFAPSALSLVVVERTPPGESLMYDTMWMCWTDDRFEPACKFRSYDDNGRVLKPLDVRKKAPELLRRQHFTIEGLVNAGIITEDMIPELTTSASSGDPSP